ncbi:MAG: hypothetical protein K2Q28_03845 [Hyphomicrobium sp.]|nr:hypothetical protein [Hyphomicrobium sp.]
MDLHEQRMQCLKMAFDLGGKPEAVLSAAQQLFDFVTGPVPTVEAKTDAHEPVIEAPVAEETVPDPIAACGTVLVMQEGGELADAVTTADPLPAAAEAEEAAVAELASSDSETAATVEVAEENSAGFDEAEAAVEEEASDSGTAAEVAEPEAEQASELPTDSDATPVAATCEEGSEIPASIN